MKSLKIIGQLTAVGETELLAAEQAVISRHWSRALVESHLLLKSHESGGKKTASEEQAESKR